MGRFINSNNHDNTINRQAPEFWKLEVLYFNKKDKSMIVPSRYGFGFALNYGHRTVQTFLALLGLAIVGTIIYLVVI